MNDYTEVETCVEVSVVQRFVSSIAPPDMRRKTKATCIGLVQNVF